MSLIVLLALTGCLPGSGQRESRELFPADSISRELAAGTPVEHLMFVTQSSGPDERPMQIPHSVQLGPDGSYYVADTKRNSLYKFDADGRFERVIESDAFGFPYMVGSRGDSVAVMNRASNELFFVTEDGVGRRIPLPGGEYVAALATEDRLFYKVTAEDETGFLQALSEDGSASGTPIELSGPYWRYVGFLREWNGAVVSLTGYRPVIDIVQDGSRLDTLALVGFDSPMLARTRLFMLGRTSQLPLLTSSARPADSLLFVLNLRPGWIRVDVYDERGRLHRVLEQEDPEFDRRLYPLDLAVNRRQSGAYDIAIVGEHPAPRLTIYRWTPEAATTSATD